MDTFDLERVKGFLLNNPDCNVIIIANNRKLSEEYWNRIQQHTGIKKRPWIATNANAGDGFPFIDSLVLKIGRWWENKHASEFIRVSRVAKLSLPIAFIPPFITKGGDNE